MPNTVHFFIESSSSLILDRLLLANDIADKGIRQDFKYNGLFPEGGVERVAPMPRVVNQAPWRQSQSSCQSRIDRKRMRYNFVKCAREARKKRAQVTEGPRDLPVRRGESRPCRPENAAALQQLS